MDTAVDEVAITVCQEWNNCSFCLKEELKELNTHFSISAFYKLI